MCVGKEGSKTTGAERCGAPRRSGEPPARQDASAEPAERHPEGVPSILG